MASFSSEALMDYLKPYCPEIILTAVDQCKSIGIANTGLDVLLGGELRRLQLQLEAADKHVKLLQSEKSKQAKGKQALEEQQTATTTAADTPDRAMVQLLQQESAARKDRIAQLERKLEENERSLEEAQAHSETLEKALVESQARCAMLLAALPPQGEEEDEVPAAAAAPAPAPEEGLGGAKAPADSASGSQAAQAAGPVGAEAGMGAGSSATEAGVVEGLGGAEEKIEVGSSGATPDVDEGPSGASESAVAAPSGERAAEAATAAEAGAQVGAEAGAELALARTPQRHKSGVYLALHPDSPSPPPQTAESRREAGRRTFRP